MPSSFRWEDEQMLFLHMRVEGLPASFNRVRCGFLHGRLQSLLVENCESVPQNCTVSITTNPNVPEKPSIMVPIVVTVMVQRWPSCSLRSLIERICTFINEGVPGRIINVIVQPIDEHNVFQFSNGVLDPPPRS